MATPDTPSSSPARLPRVTNFLLAASIILQSGVGLLLMALAAWSWVQRIGLAKGVKEQLVSDHGAEKSEQIWNSVKLLAVSDAESWMLLAGLLLIALNLAAWFALGRLRSAWPRP